MRAQSVPENQRVDRSEAPDLLTRISYLRCFSIKVFFYFLLLMFGYFLPSQDMATGMTQRGEKRTWEGSEVWKPKAFRAAVSFSPAKQMKLLSEDGKEFIIDKELTKQSVYLANLLAFSSESINNNLKIVHALIVMLIIYKILFLEIVTKQSSPCKKTVCFKINIYFN